MDAETFDIVGDFAIALATLALTAVTIAFSNNYRQKVRLELASARLSSFGELFEITGLAAPTRLGQAGEAGVLTSTERDELYRELTTWYYRKGNGMMLEGPTREVFIKAKRNLNCATSEIDPPEAWTALCRDFDHDPKKDSDRLRGLMSMRQFSLLRSQLKAELAIFGNPFAGSLANHEAVFLRECGVDLNQPPWEYASAQPRHSERIKQLTAEVKPLALPERSAESS